MLYRRVLLTGASGRIGSCLRAGLRDELEELRLTDRRPLEVPPVQGSETFAPADLTDPAAVEQAMAGVEAVVHLGAAPGERPFDELLGPNVVGSFNVFDAARRTGVRRVVFASSNHATGFYPVGKRLTGVEPVRPDGLYGASKVWGEALGRMYFDRFGIEAICLRIGAFQERPREPSHLANWLSHGDAVRLVRACLTAPDIGFLVVYGVSANTRSWWEIADAAARLGYEPQDDADRFAAEIDGPDPERQGDPFTEPRHGRWA
jgi:uronate dehydrogenase